MRKFNLTGALATLATVLSLGAFQSAQAVPPITAAEARAIAKEAYLYANPMADNYRIFYVSFVNQADPEFKTHLNQLRNLEHAATGAGAVRNPHSRPTAR